MSCHGRKFGRSFSFNRLNLYERGSGFMIRELFLKTFICNLVHSAVRFSDQQQCTNHPLELKWRPVTGPALLYGSCSADAQVGLFRIPDYSRPAWVFPDSFALFSASFRFWVRLQSFTAETDGRAEWNELSWVEMFSVVSHREFRILSENIVLLASNSIVTDRLDVQIRGHWPAPPPPPVYKGAAAH